MGLALRYATEADAPMLGHINIVCFNRQELWGSVYPALEDEAVLPVKVARALQKLADPAVHVVVAVNTDAPGQPVIGYSRWTIPGSSSVVELSLTGQGFAGADNLPEGANRRVLKGFQAKLKECRKEYLVEGDLILDFLATLPQYQGRGVASALLRWGMESAAERGVGIFLEATMDGYALYRKFGWEDAHEVIMEYEPLGGRGSQRFMLMRRAP